jgi:hypothetical protein
LGNLEDDSTLVVLLGGGVEVEIGQRDSSGVTGGEVEERGADDRIVSDFKLVAVFEDEERGRKRRLGVRGRVVGRLAGRLGGGARR